MKKIWVFADFDWLKQIELVGELSFESIRGTASYRFKYSAEWLRKHSDIILGDDINNYSGIQYTKPNKDIFGCFADTLPDRWGRMLLNRREQIFAREEKRPVKTLSSLDYLVGIDDFSRIGGLRFKNNEDENFINAGALLSVPPLAKIRDLIQASKEIEKSEEKNELPEKKWLNQLLHPGTSLGGARPKASLTDEEKNLYIAKFPSLNDNYNVGLWEHFSHILAKRAGINVAATQVLKSGEKYHTLLSKRFDRNNEHKRIHFASAMTMLGCTDGDNYSNGHGYLDIVDFILKSCTDVEKNLEELFRRIAFYICIGCTDDHLRNHGFLLKPKGWTLSPAYDINPSLNAFHSLLITPYSNESNLNMLSESSDDYFLEKEKGQAIIKEVLEALKSWRNVAKQLKIPKVETDRFCSKFDYNLSWEEN